MFDLYFAEEAHSAGRGRTEDIGFEDNESQDGNWLLQKFYKERFINVL